MYVSLHNRSAYSFGSSLIRVEALPVWAERHQMPAVALTDLNGLYGAVKFQEHCRARGVKPIFGAEMRLHELDVTLLARTQRGYTNLCKLVSLHHLREDEHTEESPAVGLRDVIAHNEDLVCLVGRTSREGIPAGVGARIPMSIGTRTSGISIGTRVSVGGCLADMNGRITFSLSRLPTLNEVLVALRDSFADRLYVELAIHSPADVPIARKRAQIADELGIPVVATSEARCIHREDNTMLRALASIGTLTLIDRPHPDKPEGLWHLRTPLEMQRLFARRPDALQNTLKIAEQCNVTLDMHQNRFPPFVSPDGRSASQHLHERCLAGCKRRYLYQPQYKGIGGKKPRWDEVTARLDRELRIIDQVQYAEYFLVFDDILRYCNQEGIATLARGSAADSLVCYALGVSQACPFRFDLPFDRFINVERAKFSKLADIDLDLPWDQRDKVINWVFKRWGEENVAMIGTANTFHGRAALAELGKAYGLPAHEVYKATKVLPRSAATTLSETVKELPEAREIPVHDEPYRTILQIVCRLEGLPRHWSMHPCGIVVSPEPLGTLVPVQRSPKGPLIAQYDMDSLEELGFIKIDLLGQAGLSVLRDTVAELKRTENIEVDLERDVDYSESETWDMIASGQARGVHHIESPAMTSLLVQSQCRDIDCLTTIVALIRPGAANQGKKEIYCRRHQGYEPATYAHPSLETILKGTYGLMMFEEHILQIAVEFAKMNMGRADVLRRALNKENRRMIADMSGEFRECALENGRTPEEIEAVWSVVNGFAGFMFNKAHSAEYALEAFQGAWLKRRWPAHYVAAILSNYRGFYAHSPTLPQILYVLEALRQNVGFLSPCVNRSRPHFAVERVECANSGLEQETFTKAQTIRTLRGSGGNRLVVEQAPNQIPNLKSEISNRESPNLIAPSNRWFIRVPISHIKGMSPEFAVRWWAQREKCAFTCVADFLDRCRPGESEARLLLDTGALDVFGHSRPELFWHLHHKLSRSARMQSFLLQSSEIR